MRMAHGAVQGVGSSLGMGEPYLLFENCSHSLIMAQFASLVERQLAVYRFCIHIGVVLNQLLPDRRPVSLVVQMMQRVGHIVS